jgi:signal transduction histidine kinase
MRERAESIGAELRLTSRPGHGTILTVNWSGTAVDMQE